MPGESSVLQSKCRVTAARSEAGAVVTAFQLFLLSDGYLESLESVSGGACIKTHGYLRGSRVARFEVDDMVNLPGAYYLPILLRG